ncbi:MULTISPECIES: NAD(P)/FAD-dependent oxidoreductase [Gordonia]|uniref:Putative ferredoxin reductase n=1 Tax=Gordonia sputi NBRC 100414 TaxID=1089453 RepID=H5TX30_9ACTN|nr:MULTISPECIES: FAD/NAD(P)-binding oxidoreductase [Gordonia]NKY94900.1 NAD(P)/FAD-dependent oxidoreductase [Gordonia sputi]OBA42928.1 pyridine nucleotide-disulfide oxidoreductase [Gordonia sp. 852002-51296_SCH5728562-b]GAB38038.1 putative ferredoxin reductase [Gordonia sputi NBRC 100414]
MTTIAIVGGGLAGAKAAEALREQDFDGDVVIFGVENELPYERPPLSKEFMQGSKDLPEFTVHDTDWYLDQRVEFRPGTRIEKVDAAAKTVSLPDGTTLTYDKLLLATGSSSRVIDLPGADSSGVHYLRTIDDARAIRETLTEGSRLAIVGAGWIGMEVAASARERGVEVAIAEASKLPLLRALGPEVAQIFADLHREHGVDLRTEVKVAEITTENGVATGLRLADGDTIAADTVLIAAGAVPNLDVAESAGLDVDGGGVLVNAGLRSSDPDIYVVGDIANAEHPILERRVRVEHWANALNQPAVAVTNMLGGSAEYENLPYFFTDQYDLGMEYSGLADGYEKVVFRGDVPGREFVVFWLDGDNTVLAGMQVNIWDQLDGIKQLILGGDPVDPDALADSSVALADL